MIFSNIFIFSPHILSLDIETHSGPSVVSDVDDSVNSESKHYQSALQFNIIVLQILAS